MKDTGMQVREIAGWGGEQVLNRMVRKDLNEKVGVDSFEEGEEEKPSP